MVPTSGSLLRNPVRLCVNHIYPIRDVVVCVSLFWRYNDDDDDDDDDAINNRKESLRYIFYSEKV